MTGDEPDTGAFARHLERQNVALASIESPRKIDGVAWALMLAVAGTAGIVVAALTTPPDSNGGFLELPWLLPSFGILTVLCGIAGFSPVTFGSLLVLSAVPWPIGWAVSAVCRN